MNEVPDSLYAVAFAAGFLLGGLIVIYIATSHRRLVAVRYDDPVPWLTLMPAALVGAVLGADLAAVLTDNIAGPLVLGVIVGSIAMIKAALE